MKFKTALPALPEARSFGVLLLLVFALFAPLGVSLQSTTAAANQASGGCDMLSSSGDMDCCCAGPVLIEPVPKSCCSSPEPVESQVKVSAQSCTCDSKPLAPTDELPPVQFTALAAESDSSAQLLAAIHAASLQPAAPALGACLSPLAGHRQNQIFSPVLSAPNGLDPRGTAQWLGLLRGTNSRLAFLAINRC